MSANTKTEKASELLVSWHKIHNQLYPPPVLIALAKTLPTIPQGKEYITMRDMCSEELIQFIEKLSTTPYAQWGNEVLILNETLRVFLRDRTDFVAAHLDHLGEAEVTHDTRVGDFLREALVDWWDKRDKSLYL